MQLDTNTAQSAISVVFGVLTVAAAMVRLLGQQNTGWGRFILKIGNDFLPHKPPTDPASNSTPQNADPKQPSSGLMFVGLAIALFATGCGATLKGAIATAVQAGEVSAAGLVVIRATVDSYFAQHPMPVLQASVDDLVTNVAAADEALVRLGEGHDKISGGDVATAVSRLVKAYDDLMQTLHTIGIVAPAGAAGDGEPIYVFRVGARTGQPAPSLPEIARWRR